MRNERRLTDRARCHGRIVLPDELGVGGRQGRPIGAQLAARSLHGLAVDLFAADPMSQLSASGTELRTERDIKCTYAHVSSACCHIAWASLEKLRSYHSLAGLRCSLSTRSQSCNRDMSSAFKPITGPGAPRAAAPTRPRGPP